MPYKSRAQQKLFHSKNSPVDPATVKEFDQATKEKRGGFKSLPEKKGKPTAKKK